MRRLLLLVLLLAIATPTRAAALPQLTMFSVNDRGTADLLPGQHLLVVVELRSDDRQSAAITHPTLPGLVLSSFEASSGALAAPDLFPPGSPPPFITWTGEVSATQPVNIRLVYAVPLDATPGDRMLTASGQAGGVSLAANTLIRVCCTPAPTVVPPPVYQRYLPVFR